MHPKYFRNFPQLTKDTENKVSLNILGHSLSIAIRLVKIYRGVFVTAKLEIHRISINMRTAQIVQKRIQIVKISILDC